MRAGELDPARVSLDDLSPAAVEAAADQAGNGSKRRAQYKRQHRLREQGVAADNRPQLAGKTVHFAAGLALPDLPTLELLLRGQGLQRVRRLGLADIMVVATVTDPGPECKFAAQIVGGIICDDLYINSVGISGMALAYKPHMAVRHLVWISPGFLDTHPTHNGIILDSIGRPACKWKLVAPAALAHFRARSITLRQQRHTRMALAFVTEPEQAMDELEAVTLKFTPQDAQIFFNDVQPCRSRAGACLAASY